MAAALYKTAGASRSINREDEDVENIEVIPPHFVKEFSVQSSSVLSTGLSRRSPQGRNTRSMTQWM